MHSLAGPPQRLSPCSRNKEHDTSTRCPAKTPKNLSHPSSGTEIVIRNSFVSPQIKSPRVSAWNEQCCWAPWQMNQLW